MAIYLLQALLIAALLALDRHLRKVIANEALQHALRHTAAVGESVLAAVITNTLWHCLSHHQWADVAAAAYGCVAAYALTHSAWVNHLDVLAVYHDTSAGTKAVAVTGSPMRHHICAGGLPQAAESPARHRSSGGSHRAASHCSQPRGYYNDRHRRPKLPAVRGRLHRHLRCSTNDLLRPRPIESKPHGICASSSPPKPSRPRS